MARVAPRFSFLEVLAGRRFSSTETSASPLVVGLGLVDTGPMEHKQHGEHAHAHGDNCSHTKVQHAGHVDYLHDGHLHNMHEGHVDEHVVELSAEHPDACTTSHDCGGHASDHTHGANCGHETVPHADHADYLVAGHLHHAHDAHCDDHGALALA